MSDFQASDHPDGPQYVHCDSHPGQPDSQRTRQGNARLFFRLYVAPLYAGSGKEFLKGMKWNIQYPDKVKGYTPTDVVV